MRIFSWENEQDIDTLMTPRDSILYYKSFLNAGMMSMEPQTGEVKAWVGGINFKHFKYEHVKQARRQVGSTFKPFVYATAIDQLHLSPCYKLPRQALATLERSETGKRLESLLNALLCRCLYVTIATLKAQRARRCHLTTILIR